MRAYRAGSEEALRVRDLLKDWAGEGLISGAQYRLMEAETVCELRRTNIFLRLVLFLFTLVVVRAAGELFFRVFLPQLAMRVTGYFLMMFAAVSYAAAEFAVSRARLYRYGIEEALAACSVGFLCAGMQAALFSGHYSPTPNRMEFLVPAAGAVFSLWIWHRFGLAYAPLAAMIFVVWMPGNLTSSHVAQHVIVTAFYAAGLMTVVAVRTRDRFTYLNSFKYLNDRYSIAEALLWLGIYLAINLQLSSLTPLGQWRGVPGIATEFPRRFYRATWVLIWCLPPVVLVRGMRLKDRRVIAAGAIAAVLTLVTNKPYLGWQLHSWDPMLLGAFLIGVALFIRRWLAAGPGEIRHGFTARRLSGKDKHWMNVGAAALGLIPANIITPVPQAASPDFQFGGGDSGGGGATSDF